MISDKTSTGMYHSAATSGNREVVRLVAATPFFASQDARSSPFPEGAGLPDRLVVHARITSARKKGLTANRQPLHKGASGMSEPHQP